MALGHGAWGAPRGEQRAGPGSSAGERRTAPPGVGLEGGLGGVAAGDASSGAGASPSPREHPRSALRALLRLSESVPPVPVSEYPRLRLLAKQTQLGVATEFECPEREVITSEVPAAALEEAARVMTEPSPPVDLGLDLAVTRASQRLGAVAPFGVARGAAPWFRFGPGAAAGGRVWPARLDRGSNSEARGVAVLVAQTRFVDRSLGHSARSGQLVRGALARGVTRDLFGRCCSGVFGGRRVFGGDPRWCATAALGLARAAGARLPDQERATLSWMIGRSSTCARA